MSTSEKASSRTLCAGLGRINGEKSRNSDLIFCVWWTQRTVPGTRRSPADPQGVVSRLKVKPVPKNVTENKNAVRAAAAAVRAGRGGPGGGRAGSEPLVCGAGLARHPHLGHWGLIKYDNIAHHQEYMLPLLCLYLSVCNEALKMESSILYHLCSICVSLEI